MESTGGMMTAENKNTWRKTCPSTTPTALGYTQFRRMPILKNVIVP
jgi:hypothetical protein